MGICVAALVLGIYSRRLRERRPRTATGLVAVVALVVAGGALPLDVWRIAQDVRYTTQLNEDEREGAGPIQAFLQPYLLDDAARVLPLDATYAAVAGAGVPYSTAREAFPPLALSVLFPRVSREPAAAEWIVAWGADPSAFAPVDDVRTVTPRSGQYPPVLVARVAR